MVWENPVMQALIPMIDQLQDALSSAGPIQLDFDLPRIAVVGERSVGKSSVLEAFVGKDFLPRGSDIVTRRPLEIQLIHDRTGVEYGEFLHKEGQKFVDFDMIRVEIEQETDRVAGTNPGISPIPINLRIYSPNVLNLTLIDLPGLTKIPVSKKPSDIEAQVRDITLSYVTKVNCLILAVAPADADLAALVGLKKLVKQVDPSGLRTIGVITKLDLMDQGTDARELLENRLLPLKRGYVGVVNRSQNDIDAKNDIQFAAENEKRFILNHPTYRHMADRMGARYLQKILNQLLTNHIRDALPSLRDRLQQQLLRPEIVLAECQDRLPDDSSSRPSTTTILRRTVEKFADNFGKSIEGCNSDDIRVMDELSSGARIHGIFRERFAFDIVKMEIDEKQLRQEIAVAIRNIRGIRGGLFTPDVAFEAVVKKQIARLREPVLKCVDLVETELMSVVRQCADNVSRYPRLMKELERIVTSRIIEMVNECKDHLSLMMKTQLAYINVNHEDFIGFDNVDSSEASADHKNFDNNRQRVIRKGWLSISRAQSMRQAFFVLRWQNLSWYKDEEEKENEHMLHLDGLMQREVDAGFLSGAHTFALFYPDGGQEVFEDQQQFEISTQTQDEADAWKASFLRAGVYPEKDIRAEAEAVGSLHPQLVQQVETIKKLIDSYMRIVTKTIRDMVPKYITLLIIQNTRDFIKNELLGRINQIDDQAGLMEESEEETRRHEKILQMHRAARGALRIIDNINRSAVSSTVVLPSFPIGSAAAASPPVNQPVHLSSPSRKSPTPAGLLGSSPRPSAPEERLVQHQPETEEKSPRLPEPERQLLSLSADHESKPSKIRSQVSSVSPKHGGSGARTSAVTGFGSITVSTEHAAAAGPDSGLGPDDSAASPAPAGTGSYAEYIVSKGNGNVDDCCQKSVELTVSRSTPVECLLSHVEHPSFFWIQLSNTIIEQIDDEIMQELETSKSALSEPKAGDYCVAPVEEDDQLMRRAKILQIKENALGMSFAKILYIDTGKLEWVSTKALLQIPARVRHFSRQACPCILADVEPVDKTWDESVIMAFRNLCGGGGGADGDDSARLFVQALDQGQEPAINTVALYRVKNEDMKAKETVSIHLIRAVLGKVRRAERQVPAKVFDKENCDVIGGGDPPDVTDGWRCVVRSLENSEEAAASESPQEPIVRGPERRRVVPGLVQGFVRPLALQDAVDPAADGMVYFHVTEVVSPSEFYVQIRSKDGRNAQLDELSVQLNSFYSNPTNRMVLSRTTTTDAQFAVVSYPVGGTAAAFRRIMVRDWFTPPVVGNETRDYRVNSIVTATFVDDGFCRRLKTKDIFMLDQRFCALRAQAAFCKLYDCAPNSASGTWDRNAIDIFRALTMPGKPLLKALVVTEKQPFELIVIRTEHDGTDTFINTKMVEAHCARSNIDLST